MKYSSSLILVLLFFFGTGLSSVWSMESVPVWDRFEVTFESQNMYENPLYEISEFYALFNSPSGKKIRINGF